MNDEGLRLLRARPWAGGYDDPWVLALASVAVAVFSVVRGWLSEPGPDPVPLGWNLAYTVIIVGWSIAVLVTARPATVEPAVQAADQARQDP
ncbi:hypothetical protein [Actinoplanes derwentensis]|nr:hypothetical protein [Actinoplanes derwentensis]GID82982.1 hypothetical protein Ade03nite_19060 [Actinoplanes derwentensis]